MTVSKPIVRNDHRHGRRDSSRRDAAKAILELAQQQRRHDGEDDESSSCNASTLRHQALIRPTSMRMETIQQLYHQGRETSSNSNMRHRRLVVLQRPWMALHRQGIMPQAILPPERPIAPASVIIHSDEKEGKETCTAHYRPEDSTSTNREMPPLLFRNYKDASAAEDPSPTRGIAGDIGNISSARCTFKPLALPPRLPLVMERRLQNQNSHHSPASFAKPLLTGRLPPVMAAKYCLAKPPSLIKVPNAVKYPRPSKD